jgi:hypothetical protein
MFVLNALEQAFIEHIVGKTEPPVRNVKSFFDSAGCYRGQDFTYGYAKLTERLIHIFKDHPDIVVPCFNELFIFEAGKGEQPPQNEQFMFRYLLNICVIMFIHVDTY